MPIRIGAKMCQRHRAQSRLIPFAHLIGTQNRISAFHRQNKPHGCIVRWILPVGNTGIEIYNRLDKPNFSAPFQRPIIRQMRLPARISHILCAYRIVRIVLWILHATHNGRKHNPHAPFAHLGQTNSWRKPLGLWPQALRQRIWMGRQSPHHTVFALAQHIYRLREISAIKQRVKRHIEMPINNQIFTHIPYPNSKDLLSRR